MHDGNAPLSQSYLTPARNYAPGIGDAVADRTINRKLCPYTKTELPPLPPGVKDDREFVRETWADVAQRVARGNTMLTYNGHQDFDALHHHMRQASILLSGRHLQHGDATQVNRNQEVFSNCSTSAASFLTFYLLLNGSGVGRSYDDEMMVVNWTKMPIVVPVIDQMHADVLSGEIKFFDAKTADHLYLNRTRVHFQVPDSREGWAKAIEKMEIMTANEKTNTVLILDFSGVRPKGTPINGMQGRPASGPCALMVAIANMARLRSSGMESWRAAMYADHYLSECVLVGGARRAARMSTKTWRDQTAIDFISVKRGGFLWSSNNSLTVDEEFWKLVRTPLEEIKRTECEETVRLAQWARRVFDAAAEGAYKDGTGEPGFINADKLQRKDDGLGKLVYADAYAGCARYTVEEETKALLSALVDRWVVSGCPMIVNPCGEIVLSAIGGYCVIGDVVPYHAAFLLRGDGNPCSAAAWDDDAEDAFCTTARALMRVNTMDCLYKTEVERTNRIGVGITGFHEWAWARFGFGWKEIVDEQASLPMWRTLSRFKRAIDSTCVAYAAELGVAVPHTNTTIKPAGTTSKLFALTEGAHLTAMREYLRWVQFRTGDPLIADYQAKGYPVRELKVYAGTTIVGFPTRTEICNLGMGDKLITAGEATPEEQYRYLQLMEKWWIQGCDEHDQPLESNTGNQVSYTLKIDPTRVSFDEFKRVLLECQSKVRACSVMLQEDSSAYEYQPEQAVTKAEFEQIAAAIKSSEVKEDIGLEHVDCAGGACPISFNENQ